MALRSAATATEVEEELRAQLGDGLLEFSENFGQLIARVAPDRRPDAMRALKTMGLTFLVFCCAVDWPEENRFEILDHVYSIKDRQRITVKCDIPRDNPRVATVSNVYSGADWYERETAELFGVIFVGHPSPRRLLLPDFFDGFPMRKDFELRARVEKPWPGEFFEG